MNRTWAEQLSHVATQWTGTSSAFLLAVAAIVVWIVTGPLFCYSDTWQLVINTATTIVTFLMVFLIQRSQNKDSVMDPKCWARIGSKIVRLPEGAWLSPGC